ncbi:MAG: hypothetical protein ACYSWU_17645 [Planctomycetota bacterium]|jgi:hypothetical protein
MICRKLALFVVVLMAVSLGRVQAQDQLQVQKEDALAARRAELEERAQQAYDRILASQTEPLAKTAEDVIQRCIEAMGGRQALASLRTLTMTSKGHMISGGFGTTRHLKAPNFIRQLRSGGRAIVTDGVSAWLVEGEKWQPAPPGRNVWQQMMSITLDLVSHAEKKVSYELLDTVPLEGSALHKLRKTLSTGKEVYVYFSIETGLLMMEEEFGDDGWKANLYFDHREVAGVKLPHMRVRVADVLKTAHVALLSYQANEPLEDSLFLKP